MGVLDREKSMLVDAQIANIKCGSILQWVLWFFRCPLAANIIIIPFTTVLTLLVLANSIVN